MVLKKIDIERLNKFKEDVAFLKLRFPIAEISKKLEMDKGNVSAYYNGKKPLSENFLNRFDSAFGKLLNEKIDRGKVIAPAKLTSDEVAGQIAREEMEIYGFESRRTDENISINKKNHALDVIEDRLSMLISSIERIQSQLQTMEDKVGRMPTTRKEKMTVKSSKKKKTPEARKSATNRSKR